MEKTPEIEIGIVSAEEIRFRLNTPYRLSGTEEIALGEGMAMISSNGKISVFIKDSGLIPAKKKSRKTPAVKPDTDFALLEPMIPGKTDFELYNVVIGIQFHWERKEKQRFIGNLKFIQDSGSIVAVNILPIEDYLVSVISSEMSTTSSPEFLKAHAVISRSWLLAQKEKAFGLHQSGEAYRAVSETPDEYCRWYDREDHKLFDVCADDHCQRYQGITKAFAKISEEAVRSTCGEVLTFQDRICDARFSKCCGGITENFENNWEPVIHPYLTKVRDCKDNFTTDLTKARNCRDDLIPDLTKEPEAEKWIRSAPEAFCNTSDKKVLSQVLNDYDQETTTFYRWTVTLTQEQISDLLRRKTGWDFGDIIDLIPVERGYSGRLIRLKIVGTKKNMTIGKELFIRKALSESHLYSSAFIVEKNSTDGALPAAFTLIGAGWGHGSGLCQIGAAMMGEKGYTYKEILTHYFKGATLEKRY